MAITHQDIADRLLAAAVDSTRIREAERQRFEGVRGELRQQCGAIGHIFTVASDPLYFATGKCCCVCGAPQPKDGA